ncbi:MAG: putative peptide maturation dehydrogenase [Pseudomonadota bacterium]
MLLRRCATVFVEPRETLAMDFVSLLSGGAPMRATPGWVALAPHLGREVALDADALAALGAISCTLWMERGACELRHGAAVIDRLLTDGLLICDDRKYAATQERDDTLRAGHWQGVSALMHVFSRWRGVRANEKQAAAGTLDDLVAARGLPPPEAISRAAAADALSLPAAPAGKLDETLFERRTGRNFDPAASISQAGLARLLQRTFGAQQEREIAAGLVALKKTSPSAGGLHPIEAYVLVQRVDGVAPGLYHYHTRDHVLEPVCALDAAQARAFGLEAVANQHWFADAPVMVVLAARVARNFWKYRNHPKAYRAITLDAGHLSQTFYLLAAEAGLPAFITAAINEADIEQALGLDPLQDAVIAVCGCGPALPGTVVEELRYER